jgi:hypothetical protein
MLRDAKARVRCAAVIDTELKRLKADSAANSAKTIKDLAGELREERAKSDRLR